MISIVIDDVKEFMARLLVKSDFDNFYLNEMEILTSHRVMINGKINKEWTEDFEQYEEFMRWRDIKKYAYDCIKGNKTPH